MKERALLITTEFQSIARQSILEDIANELEALAVSAGLEVASSQIIRQRQPTPTYLIGLGKAQELAQVVEGQAIGVVVFDSSLSPSQQRNLEEILDCKTIDRTQLILDIFAQRARSMEGRLQVELAQLEYLLPRLSGKGIYLSRLGGGVGTRGPGEQKLEVDRRRIRERITLLSRELNMLQARHSRGILKKKDTGAPLICLVGYTNAGKSSLFNALTDASAVVKDQLFSTLDTTVRLLRLPGNRKAFLVDTVGFARNLPHHLIEAFKATLEEARQADLLLHVVDVTRSDVLSSVDAVHQVLQELGVDQKKVLPVLNKIDLARADGRLPKSLAESAIRVSAKTREGLPSLCDKICEVLFCEHKPIAFFLPARHLGMAHLFYEEGEVLVRKDTSKGSRFIVNLSYKAEQTIKKKLATVGAWSALLAVALTFAALGTSYADFYEYTNKKGQSCVVDDVSKIPEEFREHSRKILSTGGSSEKVWPPSGAVASSPPASPAVSSPSGSKRRPSVEIFTTSWCHYCKELKNFLNSHGVDYKEYDVEKNPGARSRYKSLGGNGVPLTLIGGSKMIAGYDPDRILAALES